MKRVIFLHVLLLLYVETGTKDWGPERQGDEPEEEGEFRHQGL